MCNTQLLVIKSSNSNIVCVYKSNKCIKCKLVKQAVTELQSLKKGCSTVALLPEEDRRMHSCQKDFGQVYHSFFHFIKTNLSIWTRRRYHRVFCTKLNKDSGIISYYKINDSTLNCILSVGDGFKWVNIVI